MGFIKSLTSERFRTTFLVFYVLSSLLPILILMYVITQYVRPHLTPNQVDALMDPVTYGLVIMLVMPIFGLVLMTWWIKSLESLTNEIKTKSAEVLSERVEITENNEIFTLKRHMDGLFGELKGKISQIDRYSKELDESKKKITELAVTDELTTLYNRRHFDKTLFEQVQKAEKGKYNLALVMLDVDGFKKYNQSYGHPAGDELLRSLGLLLQDYLRKIGLPFRYGGDEFGVILPRKNVEEAAALAHKLVEAASHISIKGTKGDSEKLSLSCGVVSYDGNFSGLFAEADRCLQEAASSGRGSVVLLTPKNPAG
ncbi:MAG: GGDEF domain-containing protein [Thermodesulfobacteriota bacterium]